MKQLKNMFKLSHRVAVYVPSKQQNGDKISNRTAQISKVRNRLSVMFGGCTSTKAVGSWVLQSGKLQNEPVELCYSFASELTEEHIQQLIDIGTGLKQDMNQEAISIEIDGELYFI